MMAAEQIQFPCKMALDNEAYHKVPAAGSSDLKVMLRSPQHYLNYKKNPPKQTPAMRIGTLIHMAILETDLYGRAVVMPEFEGRGSTKLREAFELENHGKLIISLDEKETVSQALKAVSSHPLARRLLAAGKAEEAHFWIDELTALPCKCKPDFFRDGMVIDIKTTTDASVSEFQKDITHYKYHLQGYHYTAGVSAVLGENVDTFLIVAIEKVAPFGIQVFQLDQATLDKGGELRNRALLRLKAARDSGIYPGYSTEIVPMNLAPWGWTE